MEDFKNKYLKKLKRKAREISGEFEQTELIYLEAKREFVEAIIEYCDKNNKKSPLEFEKKKEKPDRSELFQEEEVKDVYRKIAINTHPDKTIKLKEKDREITCDLFNNAAQAKENESLLELSKVASKLKINLNNLTYSQLESLEAELQEKEGEIKKMREDICWAWHFMNKNQKKNIIYKICER